eukprot:735594-Ditylum_brightwellii.AAC.1
MLRANTFCTYKACNKGNPQARCRGQYKFLSEALDAGFKWADEELKQKKNGIHPNFQNCIQLSPSRVPSECPFPSSPHNCTRTIIKYVFVKNYNQYLRLAVTMPRSLKNEKHNSLPLKVMHYWMWI